MSQCLRVVARRAHVPVKPGRGSSGAMRAGGARAVSGGRAKKRRRGAGKRMTGLCNLL